MSWTGVCDEAELRAGERMVVRAADKQILLLPSQRGVFACANRCPHEGYPLSESALTSECILTCNWHNWKFDISSGETLVGGDLLPRFPVRTENGRVLLDATLPDPAVRRAAILAALPQALADVDQQRLVRETARLVRLGADPADAVRAAINWCSERLEFGATHAIAASPDWLRLHDDPASDTDEKLAAIAEILGHIADDVRGDRVFPFHTGSKPWNEAAFLDAVEQEHEDDAIALLRGALADRDAADELLPTFIAAALAHYADFGHALIYVMQTHALIRRLGAAVAEPLPLMLSRSLVYATREDLLPEFRSYATHLSNWGGGPQKPLAPAEIYRQSAQNAMATVAGWAAAHAPLEIFPVLVNASAWTLPHVDERRLWATDSKLADNISWLDFTHALTFADAGLRAASRRPDLWPAILLQLACFTGRNSGYVDAEFDASGFAVADVPLFLSDRRAQLFDHGGERFIVSAHRVKTLFAISRLIERLPGETPFLTACLNRFLSASMRGRHILRTAKQMRYLVDNELANFRQLRTAVLFLFLGALAA